MGGFYFLADALVAKFLTIGINRLILRTKTDFMAGLTNTFFYKDPFFKDTRLRFAGNLRTN